MKKKQVTFFIITLMTLNSIISQEITLHSTKYNVWIENATIILKTGKTLSGRFKLYLPPGNSAFSSNQSLAFKENRKSKKIKFKAKDIDRVSFVNSLSDTVVYNCVRVSNRKYLLLQNLIHDKCSLYASRSYVGNIPYYYYTIKEDDSIATIMNSNGPFRSFRKQSLSVFQSCKSLVELIKERKLREWDIIDVVRKYNNCEE
ncbi:hypothetical protein D1815_19800 [Aquimarina sp. AD1]|uniref:hypothetical protein n=1 Tax=Aquimarina sp. (strain AD1) TaxID=1714848 RepID=UPI000E547FF0|nr:hypothetical protein [Aquimarina sp. AD1]AXT57887.1 hypothetical protein D1815_19800 [Aquimarina sp. AD1]RKN28036.1 hypothetical protein D7035_08640 [Aquimarina sp. AD1]